MMLRGETVVLNAFRQRHDQEEDGHDQGDAQNGHRGRDLPDDEVAKVVLERDPHQTTCRSPSTIDTLAERIAGTNPAKIPMATDAPNALRRFVTEILTL